MTNYYGPVTLTDILIFWGILLFIMIMKLFIIVYMHDKIIDAIYEYNKVEIEKGRIKNLEADKAGTWTAAYALQLVIDLPQISYLDCRQSIPYCLWNCWNLSYRGMFKRYEDYKKCEEYLPKKGFFNG